jgi:hypothetical protein
MDRPLSGWRVLFLEPDLDKQGQPRLRVAIYFEGDAKIGSVKVYGVGYKSWKMTQENRIPWNSSSEPLLFQYEPSDVDCDAFIEITWTRARPLSHRGLRVNTKTQEWEFWCWYFRSARPRRAPHRGRPELPKWLRFLEYRLVRTQGRWVAVTDQPPVSIPRTELDQADPKKP